MSRRKTPGVSSIGIEYYDEHALAGDRVRANVALLHRLAHGEVHAPDVANQDVREDTWKAIRGLTEQMREDLAVMTTTAKALLDGAR